MTNGFANISKYYNYTVLICFLMNEQNLIPILLCSALKLHYILQWKKGGVYISKFGDKEVRKLWFKT